MNILNPSVKWYNSVLTLSHFLCILFMQLFPCNILFNKIFSWTSMSTRKPSSRFQSVLHALILSRSSSFFGSVPWCLPSSFSQSIWVFHVLNNSWNLAHTTPKKHSDWVIRIALHNQGRNDTIGDSPVFWTECCTFAFETFSVHLMLAASSSPRELILDSSASLTLAFWSFLALMFLLKQIAWDPPLDCSPTTSSIKKLSHAKNKIEWRTWIEWRKRSITVFFGNTDPHPQWACG